jgi:Heparinase II/III-like protein/Heparinase II/III N-terminus
VSAISEKLRWYLYRLRAMSPGEVVHRCAEKAQKLTGQYRVPDYGRGLPPALSLPVIPGLREAVARLAATHPAVVVEWELTAARVRAGEFHFLGRDWATRPGLPDWHQDPVTGRHWPHAPYCFDIAYRHNKDLGDIKYVWELNRLQHLQPLAALACVRQDQELARLCIDQLLDWIHRNPPYRGVNWNSGIELALRALAILWLTSLLEAFFSPEEKLPIVVMLMHHGRWLHRYPSRYSSANNHLIAEGAGLYLLGELLPVSTETRHWQTAGRRILETEIHQQILPDGIGAEQSPTYTAFSLEFFLLGRCVAEATGKPFPSGYTEQLHRAGQALRAFTDKNGHLPQIGDDDEGRVLFAGFGETDYVLSILDMLAGATGDIALAPPRAVVNLRTALCGTGQAGRVPLAGVSTFAAGGYTVIREQPDGREVLLAFDHGPLGYLSIAAHGHADALALWLHLEGQPVLVDAGTYLYHAGREWRSHFRSTPAHNTLSVRGADSSILSGPFNWSHKARAELVAIHPDASAWTVTARHDGWQRRFGCLHERTLTRISSGFTVTDTLQGHGGPWPVEVGFLLASGMMVVQHSGTEALVQGPDGTALLRIVHTGILTLSTENGMESPLRGWYSPAFGQKQPATRLNFAGDLPAATPQVFTFHFM